MKTFQAIILMIFGVFIVAGVFAIATFGKFGGSGNGDMVPPEAEIWGTLDANLVGDVVRLYNQDNDSVLKVTYRQFSEDTFDTELIEALAAQRGPDAIILPQQYIVRYEDKIYQIPFSSITERTFRDTFVEGSEVYLTSEGIVALPVLVDPLVLYWNRTLFNSAAIAQPPVVWEDLLNLTGKLTKTDQTFNVLQSMIALGGYDNVAHAKEIISTLVMQAGNPIVTRLPDGRKNVLFADRLGFSEAPADSAVRFYTEFANPSKTVYSWNKALPNSFDLFLRGDLAMYLGFGSELFDIQEKNPNLNFDVTRVPQVRDGVIKATFGNFYALALLKQSNNLAGAFSAAYILTGQESAKLWSDLFNLPPARRDLLAQAPTDAFRSVFYAETLIAHAFLDPAPVETDIVFRTMVDDIISGREPVNRAVGAVDTKLQNIFDGR